MFNQTQSGGGGGAKLASLLMWMAQRPQGAGTGTPTADQLTAFNAGAGPVSAQRASTLAGGSYIDNSPGAAYGVKDKSAASY